MKYEPTEEKPYHTNGTDRILFASDFHLNDKRLDLMREIFGRVPGKNHEYDAMKAMEKQSGFKLDYTVYFLGDMILEGDDGIMSYHNKYFKEVVKGYRNFHFIRGNHDDEKSYKALFKGKPLHDHIDIPFCFEDFMVCARLTHKPMVIPEVVYSDNPSTPYPIVLNIHGHLHNLAKIESVLPQYNVSMEKEMEKGSPFVSLMETIEDQREKIRAYIKSLIKLGFY